MWSFFKLMVWGVIWLVTWPIITTYRFFSKKPRVDNCFTWAIRRWQDQDGYLVIRWCRSSKTGVKWPHFLWLPTECNEKMVHFMPFKEDQGERYLPNAFFEGKVITGDCEKEMEN